MRPGRIDLKIEVPLPNRDGRKEIFEVIARQRNKQAGRELFVEGWLTDKVLKESEGFSGADIAEIIRRVLEFKAVQEARGENPGLVNEDDILRGISSFVLERREKKENKRSLGFV